jgi:hypothetical protein
MASDRTLSLCVFVDALGWEMVRQYSFLDRLLTTKAPLHTIFGYSSTCDPTILTGKLPRDHGHFTFFYYNPNGSPFRLYRFLDLLPRGLTRRGRVRHKLSRLLRPLHGYTGYFEIYNMPFADLRFFDYSEKRDLYQPGGIISGTPTILDFLREQRIPFSLSNWRLPERKNFATLEAAIRQGEIVFAYLFLGALDTLLHARGTQSKEVASHLRGYETELSRIVEQARRHYREVRVFVFSDHGMTDVRATCDLMARVNALGLRFGVDYVAAYDSTMARFWFLNDAARNIIEAALREEPRGYVVPEATLREWGCDFPDHKYGELFFLMKPGILLCPSFMGETPLAAMHGYEPDHKESVASFMSNVEVDPMPRRLDDLYDVMRLEVTRTWIAR